MMRPLTLSELVAPLSADLLGDDREFTHVTTDSRKIVAGDLFVALKGENFDGHDYVAQVADSGAGALLVSEPVDSDLPQLRVESTLRALGLLGAYNRDLYTGPLVAITGSSGKTTVKNMVQAVLSQRGETMATAGNFNNEIGVPLTLLRLAPAAEFAVVEMGAGKAGDIDWLCQLGRPSISMLLNAMPAHLEGFGSVEDVAAAKGEIFDGLTGNDVAVFTADQSFARQWRKRAGAARILDFGLEQPAAITATNIQVNGVHGVAFTASTPEGEIAVRLNLPGRHNVANALAAIAAGLACGLTLTEIRNGLESIVPVEGRLQTLPGSDGATVIDDCYNANPGSVRAAIDLLASCEGTRTLLLGEMRELGDGSEQMHRDIGEYARNAGLDAFWGVGAELAVSVEAFGEGGRHFSDLEAAVAAVPGAFGEGDTALVKGSRGARMETVLKAMVPAEQTGRAH